MHDDNLIVGTFNVRGLNNKFKIQELVTDVEFHNIDVLCIQETHNTDEINEQDCPRTVPLLASQLKDPNIFKIERIKEVGRMFFS